MTGGNLLAWSNTNGLSFPLNFHFVWLLQAFCLLTLILLQRIAPVLVSSQSFSRVCADSVVYRRLVCLCIIDNTRTHRLRKPKRRPTPKTTLRTGISSLRVATPTRTSKPRTRALMTLLSLTQSRQYKHPLNMRQKRRLNNLCDCLTVA